jgi:hypothetical protein
MKNTFELTGADLATQKNESIEMFYDNYFGTK